ncbi:hypothetical protein [Streptomyces sp. SCL15-4]|uniref:hypothetical protein n=1 Tax=Streptomyces sp. SCL15-4 TaxID=2967221 RepID=UPI002965F8C9|nr:hypothetical protein [Streptomyces sp. SCL15-4]
MVSSSNPRAGSARAELRNIICSLTIDDEGAEQKINAFANEVLREDAEQRKAMPRTERSIWQGIADALNAAQARGMAVGIDLDGTLTDHNAWSVVWDRDARRWVLAGYDAEEATR